MKNEGATDELLQLRPSYTSLLQVNHNTCERAHLQ